MKETSYGGTTNLERRKGSPIRGVAFARACGVRGGWVRAGAARYDWTLMNEDFWYLVKGLIILGVLFQSFQR